MKKWILLALLMSGQAAAGWTQIDTDGQRTTFVDPATAQRHGKLVRMVSLIEFSRFQRMVEVGYFSQKHFHEFDCDGTRTRRYAQAFHAGHMGEGSVIYSDESEQEWEPVEAGSAVEKILKLACD